MEFANWLWHSQKRNRQSTKFLLDLYKWKKSSRSGEWKYNLNHKQKVMDPPSVPGLEPFTDAETLEWRRDWVPLGKDPGTLPTCYTLLWWLCWGKGHSQASQRLLDSGSELTLIPGDLKLRYRGGLWRSDGQCSVARVHLTVGLVGAETHPRVISPSPKCIIEIDILSNYQTPHFGSQIIVCGFFKHLFS